MNTVQRTTMCGPIAEHMKWQDRLIEYRKLRGDASLIMSLTPQERASIASALSADRRQQIIASLPDGLTKGELKRQLYFRTYGEHLPDDYFKDEDEDENDD